MPLLDRINDGLQTLLGSRGRTDRSIPDTAPDRVPVVGSRSMRRFFGLEPSEMTGARMRKAYRSLVAAFISFRAQEFVPHMNEVSVVREESQGEAEPVDTDHPWVQLLDQPNPSTSTTMLWEVAFQQMDAQGHADFAVQFEQEMGRPVPKALHLLWPAFGRARPIIGELGQTVGWEYRQTSGSTQILPPESIIRLKEPHPFGPHFTAGRIEIGAYEVDTRTAQLIFQRNKARGQGRPNMVLRAENIESLQEAKKTGRDLSRIYNERTDMVPVEIGSWSFEEMDLTPQEMEFLESMGATRDDLMTIFQIPKGMLSSEDSATGRGRSAAEKQWEKHTVKPKIRKTVEQLSHEMRRIFDARDSTLSLRPPEVVSLSPQERVEIDKKRVETGTPINRVLRERGEEEVEGGDEPLVSGSLQSLEAAASGLM